MNGIAGGAGGPPAVPERSGWHYRGYLPHFELSGSAQMITYRLRDSIPMGKRLEALESKNVPDAQKRKQLEALLDDGYGDCYLGIPAIAGMIEQNLLHFDGERYRLGAWVVMPNHVHVLIETLMGYSLSEIVHSWKSFTAKRANKILGRSGALWESEYFDRGIRDERHWLAAIAYIHLNPVKAGLVSQAADWPYSSARNWTERGILQSLGDGGRAARTPSH